jgi:hypothetical protein
LRDRTELRDEDRLPWLETVEPEDEPQGAGTRLMLIALVAILVVGVAVWGLYRWQSSGGSGGNGELIAAEAGDYKVRPDDPGGLKVEGEGDAAVATSQGKGSNNGSVDLAAVPEAPVARAPAPPEPMPAQPPAGRSDSESVPRSGGKLVAAPPMTNTRRNVPGAASGGAMVQLGAYPSEAAANTAWGGYAKRFGYLAALGKSVQKAELNGRTFYRLRVDAGTADQAASIVAKLRVAGEDSFVTS